MNSTFFTHTYHPLNPPQEKKLHSFFPTKKTHFLLTNQLRNSTKRAKIKATDKQLSDG